MSLLKLFFIEELFMRLTWTIPYFLVNLVVQFCSVHDMIMILF